MSVEYNTLKRFMEDYQGFDFENGEIVLFDADLCRQYLLSSKAWKMAYLTEERLEKRVYDWMHSSNVMTIILKDRKEGGEDHVQKDHPDVD